MAEPRITAFESELRVGVAGLGRMGSAIAARLLERGVPLNVWNRTPARAAALVALGAHRASSAAALAASSNLVITSLTDDVGLEQVYLGKNGLLEAVHEGCLFVDTSTVLPQTAIALASNVATRGCRFVDAPVLGTVTPARQGTLIAMVGGAAPDVALARTILDHIAKTVHHVGPVGAGMAMKLAVNIPLVTYWAAMADSFALIRAHSLDEQQLISIISDSPAALAQLKLKLPVLRGESTEVGFDIDGVVQLCGAMQKLAAAREVRLATIDAARALYAAAAEAGWGGRDVAAVARYSLLSGSES
jgi:3-hydroxyisobutyrate dehydrogenase